MEHYPTRSDVVAAAARLGIHLDDDEIPIYQERIATQVSQFREFLLERFDEPQSRAVLGDRSGGCRPGAEEDPHRAWAWRCKFGGETSGLLAQRTVSFKDHISVAGIPQSFNSLGLDHFIPDFDATVVTRVLASGGQVVGKNVMNGFFEDHPTPLNPVQPGYEPGGSSSGSAVAVASGEVDVSIGGDQGGSIRIPAAYCGIVGLKPTFGLVSHFGATFGFEPSLDHLGPLARSVEDVARTLDAIAGFDGLDPRQNRDVPESYHSLNAIGEGIAGLRIGVLVEGLDDPIDPAVKDGVLAAVNVLAAQGAVVREVSVPLHRAQDGAYEALAIEGGRAAFDIGPYGAWHRSYYPASAIGAVNRALWGSPDLLPPRVKANHIAAEIARRRFAGTVYAKAQNVRQAFVAAYDTALREVDVLVMPTVRQTAPPQVQHARGRLDRLIAELDGKHWMRLETARNTKPFNYTGHPALAIPCRSAAGAAVSMQLVGRHFDDALLLRAAAAYERAVE